MIMPSWEHYGTHDDSAYPELWDGCIAAWCPGLGPSGSMLADFSHSRNHGIISGSYYSPAFNALYLDGVNDYIVIPGGHLLKNRPRREFTLSAWVYQLVTDIDAYYISWPYNWGTYINIALTIRFTSVSIANSTNSTASLTPADYIGKWNFVCGTYDGNIITHRLNNQVATQSCNSDIYYNGTESLTLGNYRSTNPGDSANWNGYLDDMRVYDRALSEDEIYTLRSNRKISYTPRRPRRFYSIPSAAFLAAWARNRSAQILGGGLR